MVNWVLRSLRFCLTMQKNGGNFLRHPSPVPLRQANCGLNLRKLNWIFSVWQPALQRGVSYRRLTAPRAWEGPRLPRPHQAARSNLTRTPWSPRTAWSRSSTPCRDWAWASDTRGPGVTPQQNKKTNLNKLRSPVGIIWENSIPYIHSFHIYINVQPKPHFI